MAQPNLNLNLSQPELELENFKDFYLFLYLPLQQI